MEQRSKEWFEARKGKFTASSIHKLLSKKGLGQTGITYAEEVADSTLFDTEEDNFVSYDMQRGIELEPLAFNFIQDKLKFNFTDVVNCGFIIYDKNNNIGASPDGLIGDDTILEIKCPKLQTFLKLVRSNNIDDKYYAQMQTQMLCTGRKKALFLNYIIIDGKEYTHEIYIEEDKEFQQLIIERVKEASVIRDKAIEKLITNKQW